jgi:hypothetical protein
MPRILSWLAAGLLSAGCSQPAAERQASGGEQPAEVAAGAVARDQDQSLSERLTAPGACFARTYDAAHLAAHPRQTVTRFFVGDPGAEWRATQPAGQIIVLFGFEVVGRSSLYTGVATCATADSLVQCAIEGDGGSFTLEANDDGLRVRTARIEVEGPTDFSPDIAQADNRVMLLRPAQSSECPME